MQLDDQPPLADPNGGPPIAKPSPPQPTITDSAYASQETFTMDIDNHVYQPLQAMQETPVKEASNSSTHSDSPARSFHHSLTKGCPIAKSNSTASAATHKSIPVIGSFPLGVLQVHRASDTPQSLTTEIDPIAEAAALATPPPPTPPKCLDNGDCFVIIDLPDKFTIGLDTIALTTSDGRKFRGFRDIPPGPHFLWISEPGAISRCGYWFVAEQKGEVRVKQWDRYSEVLGEAASQFEVRENEKNIEQTYPILIPHNFQGDAASTIAPPAPPPKDQPRRGSVPDPDFAADSILIWRHLTSAINPSFLSRVTGKKTVTEWLVDTTDGAKGDIHFPGANKLLKSIVGSQLDFLFQQDIIDLQTLNIAAGDQSGTDTTSRIIAALNSSKHDSSPNPGSSTSSSPSTPAVTESDILAELQFAFLTGLHLGNYTCIEQWWHLLLKIILRAHQLVLSRPELTRSLLQTFHAQMIYNDRYIDHAAAANNPSNDTNPYRTAASAAGKDGSGSTNSVLETIPRNKAKLREALTIYKRRLNASLLGERNNISPEQGAVGHAFADLEAWFWRYGWDLRSDYVQGRGDEKEAGPGPVASSERMVLSDSDSDEGGEYAPVVVQLDENGREVGLVNLSGE